MNRIKVPNLSHLHRPEIFKNIAVGFPHRIKRPRPTKDERTVKDISYYTDLDVVPDKTDNGS